jgi:hypothetical protein
MNVPLTPWMGQWRVRVKRASGSKWLIRIVAVVVAIVVGPPLVGVIVFVVGSMIFPH